MSAVTSDLLKRDWEHKNKAVPGFTARYGVDRLVWSETHATAEAAISAGKADQGVETRLEDQFDASASNPHWIDLYPTLGSG